MTQHWNVNDSDGGSYPLDAKALGVLMEHLMSYQMERLITENVAPNEFDAGYLSALRDVALLAKKMDEHPDEGSGS